MTEGAAAAFARATSNEAWMSTLPIAPYDAYSRHTRPSSLHLSDVRVYRANLGFGVLVEREIKGDR